jgi:hypothetical protein
MRSWMIRPVPGMTTSSADRRGEQQRDAQREVPVGAEVADGDPVAVLQDEDEQQKQDQREQGGHDPDPPVRVRLTWWVGSVTPPWPGSPAAAALPAPG